jgi:8-oxo-dGTP pyrophosphatase MutT (NUDIX family)
MDEPRNRAHALARLTSATLAWIALSGPALASVPDTAAALHARYASLDERLQRNPFRRALTLDSYESPTDLKGDIHAVVDHPFPSVAAALREAEEEVGLDPSCVEILGRLPQYLTGTGFTITPVVGLVTPPLNLKLDDFEVAEVFEPPLSFLLDANNHQRQQREFTVILHEFWAMPWNDYYIWGATAGMLVSLHDVLFGEAS